MAVTEINGCFKIEILSFTISGLSKSQTKCKKADRIVLMRISPTTRIR